VEASSASVDVRVSVVLSRDDELVVASLVLVATGERGDELPHPPQEIAMAAATTASLVHRCATSRTLLHNPRSW